MKKIKEWTLEIILAAILICWIFVLGPVRVEGESMLPTVQDDSLVLTKKMFYEVDRFDIVLAFMNKTPVIKRVIGLPGETVCIDEEGVIWIDGVPLSETDPDTYLASAPYCGKTITLGEDEYFLLGDNRAVSRDSRMEGPVKRSAVFGKVVYVFGSSEK